MRFASRVPLIAIVPWSSKNLRIFPGIIGFPSKQQDYRKLITHGGREPLHHDARVWFQFIAREINTPKGVGSTDKGNSHAAKERIVSKRHPDVSSDQPNCSVNFHAVAVPSSQALVDRPWLDAIEAAMV
jgi:hypothetical protein